MSSVNETAAAPDSLLRQEYDQLRELLHWQPLATQRFLAAQAQRVGDALVRRASHVRFALPDRILVSSAETEPSSMPMRYRDQAIGRGNLLNRFFHTDLHSELARRLQKLELIDSREVSIAARLLRYAIVLYLVHELLPAGDVVDCGVTADSTRRFYRPEWVVVDQHDRLLVKSVYEARAQLAIMQRYLAVLDLAQTLALYIVTDEEHQKKYYGILDQVIDQGRALARHETKAIILEIKNRAAQHELDQGVCLDVPYFDDQVLDFRTIDFRVTPTGRVMFVPTFVVKAAREAQIRVLADIRLSPATRQQLLHELKLLEQAFDDGAAEHYRAWQRLYEQPPSLPAPLLHIAPK